MDAIDAYLDALVGRLRLSPESARRLLIETESHLRDAADAELAPGVEQEEAESRAVARFGSPSEIARAANGSLLDKLGAVLVGVTQLAAVGSAVVFAGTLLAQLLARATSAAWVFGPPAGFAPPSAQVAHWLQVHPDARGWREAATMENAADAMVLRGGAALLGLGLAVVVFLACRRRFGRIAGGVVPTTGLVAFGGAAGVLAAGAVAGSVAGVEWGRGQLWCDAAVSLVAAAGYLVMCVRSIEVDAHVAAPH